jgi:opacity protein-like surface antigen
MRKVTMLVFAAAALHAGMAAQDRTKLEVFGGYSLERTAPCGTGFGGCLSEGSPVPSTIFNGWDAAVTGYFYKSLGVTADFGGHYAHVTNSGYDLGSAHRYSFLFGPAYAVRMQRASVFAHALFGEVSEGNPNRTVVMDYTKFMWALGGGLDVNLSRNFAVRPVQLEYERNGVESFGTQSTNGFRYSAGIVVKF